MEDEHMIAGSLKEQKEAFVTGHDGTTPWEVLFVCLSAPISLACYRCLHSDRNEDSNVVTNTYTTLTDILLESLVVWFPMVLCQTKYLYPYGAMILILQAGVIFSINNGRIWVSQNVYDVLSTDPPLMKRLDFLTAYRSSILYLTFIAILAVDFHVFPRRFCKTEISGFGLMDIGAASFCLSAGLVSPRARRRRETSKAKPSSRFKPFLHTLPLVLLGAIRIFTNRELEYQEHVSEYGVHWNFFFTMGIMTLVPQLLPAQPQRSGIVPSLLSPSWILPASIMTFYQVALSTCGLQHYIETSIRHCPLELGSSSISAFVCHMFAANREGILGCLGYLSLFFLGEWIGMKYLWNQPQHTSKWGLFRVAAILWILLGVVYGVLDIPVSRRSTNIAFCLWAAAHNVLLLVIFQWIIPANNADNLPIVWETVNRYGLLMFLIANLLTGLVNLTVPTLEMSNVMAIMIVFGYICTVGVAALLLDMVWSTMFRRSEKRAQVNVDPKKTS